MVAVFLVVFVGLAQGLVAVRGDRAGLAHGLTYRDFSGASLAFVPGDTNPTGCA